MWNETVNYLVFNLMGLSGNIAKAIHFFIYDSVKILALVFIIVYIISFIQTYIDTETVRDYIQGKSKFMGNLLAAIFGILTPFLFLLFDTSFFGLHSGKDTKKCYFFISYQQSYE